MQNAPGETASGIRELATKLANRNTMKGLVCMLALLAFLIPATACEDDGPAEPTTPVMTGTWQGISGGYTMSITLREQEDGLITGNGVERWCCGSSLLTITGTHSHPQVALTLKVQGGEDMAFTGEFGSNDNEVVGQMTGSGINHYITLTRQ